MLTAMTLTALAYGAYRLVRHALQPHELAPPPLPAPVPAPPARYEYALFTPYRGAVRTTWAEANYRLAVDPGPMFDLASVMWPARRYLNKVTFMTGRPGAGKTVLNSMMMESVAKLFPVFRAQAAAGIYPDSPGAGDMRWLVIDPTEAYLPRLYQVVPGDVPIVRTSPHDAGGKRWDVAKDITCPTDIDLLIEGLLPDALFAKAGDPFWYTKGREVLGAPPKVYHHRGSAWQFNDLIIPIKYPQFLKPLLMQCPETVGLASHELVGRLGQGVVTTASSVVNKMAIAAALWSKAKETFTLNDFLENRQVIHFGFTPDMIEGLAGIANALTFVGIKKALRRNDEFNHTLFWLDEARYLADIMGLDDLAARGRGSGLGAVITAQGIPGLLAKWPEKRVRELLDLALTWITMSAGGDTADAFSRAVGDVEGHAKSYSYSSTNGSSETTTTTRSTSQGKTTYGGSTSRGWSSSSTHGESFQLTIKRAILPSEVTNLPLAYREEGIIRGKGFNPDVGAFDFELPYLPHFASLPSPLLGAMPRRPDADQRLLPWTEADVRRLNIYSDDLMEAVKKTWENVGGTP